MIAKQRSVSTSIVTATLCAFAMIATQIAGKATRDAFFLSNFDITALPVMLVIAAFVSLIVVWTTSHMMAVFGPLKITPTFFAVSGLLLLAQWYLSGHYARIAAVTVYLHIAVLGSILISGFWSVVNERFDPRTAKRSIGRIAGGATLGGLFGGILAERVAAYSDITMMLPIIAVLHLLCAWLVAHLAPATKDASSISFRAILAGRARAPKTQSGLAVLKRVGYLRNLAMVVLLGNFSATLVDYMFKAKAAATYSSGAELMRFFAVFYTAVSLITFAVQAGLTRRLLQKIGIANTVASRPAVVAVGGAITLPMMGLVGLGILRGIEAVVHSSLFRSGYEVLFTPIVPEKKRATKTIVDVGADRLGDIVGGGVVRAAILLPAAIASQVMIGAAVVVSVVAFLIARMLQRGYVVALEKSLINQADGLDISSPGDLPMQSMMMDTFVGLDLSVNMETIRAQLAPAQDVAAATDAEPRKGSSTRAAIEIKDPEISALVDLRSGDISRVRRVLQDYRSLPPLLATQAISLLAWDEASPWVSRALARCAPDIIGQLLDRLLDPDEDFAIRRRIPRIVMTCPTRRTADGLLAALKDSRFEVRYQSGRALARIREQNSSLSINERTVFARVLRESRVDRRVWESQRLLDQPLDDGSAGFASQALSDRASRSMEHVFTMLSVVLPREPLQIAYRGLLTDDAGLRGTALEYLESVLPTDIWENLRPFLEDHRDTGKHESKSREEILKELMQSDHSIQIKLTERETRKNHDSEK